MDESDLRALAFEHGPGAIVAAVFAFMFWVRMKPYDDVVTDDFVYFSGNDPWYHSRIVQLTAAHFPATPNFDPWSYFPYGTGRHSGFGGLFDQLIAFAAVILGLGDPSSHFVNTVTAVAPAVFGAATVIPVYLITRRLADRWGGLIVAGLLATASGQFLSRTIVGTADHQSAEAFFGALAVLGFLYAVQVAYAEKPTIADVRDRNWFVLRRPTTAAVIGGVAVASYLMMWGPGVMIVFTMGVFVVLQMARDRLAGRSVEYLTFATAITMVMAGILTLLYAKEYALKSTAFSLLQPLVALGIAVGAVVLFYLSRYMRREGYEDRYYPIAVATLIVGTLAITAVVFPRGIDLLLNLVKRVYSFGLLTDPSQLTVQEVRPADLDTAWRSFGAVFYVAIAGLVLMIVRSVRTNRPAELLVILWSITIFSAYFTMVRFGYYMAVNVALLSGFAIWWTGKYLLSLDAGIRDLSEIEAYQIIGVLVILIVVVPGNVVAMQDRQPVWEQADNLAGTNNAWHDELRWMRDNTPAEPLDYDRLYDAPDGGDFDYPDAAYGVMSWWDYGHWITVTGHRIPDANPFQQGQIVASAYLQAQSERRANLMLEALPTLDEQDERITELSSDELQSIVDAQSEREAGEDTRFVMIDDQMVAGKFGAIATWTGPGYSAYLSRQQFDVGNTQARLVGVNDRYRRTMMSRLYFADARNLSHYRLVHETSAETTFVSIARRSPSGEFESTGFVNRRLSGQAYQIVQGRSDLFFYDIRRASRVKTFERVEGARLTGRVDTDNRTTVIAALRFRTNTGRNVTYLKQGRTDERGRFTLIVPYATNDAVTPEDGGTNSGVTALERYRVFAGSPFAPTATGEVDVPESAIYEGSAIEVELASTRSNRSVSTNVTVEDGSATEGSALRDVPEGPAGKVTAGEGTASAEIGPGDRRPPDAIAAEPSRARPPDVSG